jgi:hypothetical protein
LASLISLSDVLIKLLIIPYAGYLATAAAIFAYTQDHPIARANDDTYCHLQTTFIEMHVSTIVAAILLTVLVLMGMISHHDTHCRSFINLKDTLPIK